MENKYTFQRIMRETMQAEGLSQHELARQISVIVGRTIYASAIQKLLKPKPTIPAGDVMLAIARILNTDPNMFVASAYASRYSENELAGMSDFVRKEFEQADAEIQRRIIEMLRKGK
jgi:transcriptional regulator with XRE-family HTH domain